LDNIIESAKQFGKVYGVIGGFHGFSNLEALKGIQLIMPCHCTVNKLNILEKFPKTARECRTGSAFEI
jgi:7,8-dihydropterin-6-yl-methyl-4-(beta-D-ribofuranosyl)aminobenzene 5'-phosphate synthase